MAVVRLGEHCFVLPLHPSRMTASADVQSRDFLHRHVDTTLDEHYIAAGALCRLSTNAEGIRDAARQTFTRIHGESSTRHSSFSLRLWADERDTSQPPWPKPYLRGLGQLVYFGLDRKSSMLFDLVRRRVIGRVSAGMATDISYWRSTIFPMLMSIVAGSVELVELHASCVAKGSAGMLLLGPGCSGKSTLAKAMLNAGFRVLSDDRIFCSIQNEGLCAYGLPRPIKLRQDAGTWFEEYRNKQPTHIQNGEPVFHFTPTVSTVLPCEPEVIVYLERIADGCCISRMKRSDVKRQIESDLLAETSGVMKEQAKVIDRLVDVPCWRLQYGARPEIIAEYLAKLFPGGMPTAAN